MKSMPQEIKNKIRQLQSTLAKGKKLEVELENMIEKYGINIDYLCANRNDDLSTEALAFVCNAEGNTEENIRLIEEVFLYYVNKTKS
jgi:fructoselysine-6-P-deglycase FrlB-like protein